LEQSRILLLIFLLLLEAGAEEAGAHLLEVGAEEALEGIGLLPEQVGAEVQQNLH
jgi:hypothetical protein